MLTTRKRGIRGINISINKPELNPLIFTAKDGLKDIESGKLNVCPPGIGP